MTGAFDLGGYLGRQRARVETALDGLLPASGGGWSRLTEAMRYAIFSGGKRLRPILVLAACEAAGGDSAGALSPACATEMVHTYSLIHDDLPAMDDDDLRRGRPTCHRAFDEALAVLAGDALLTLAFGVVAEDPGLDDATARAVAIELARGNGYDGMVGGQAADVALEGAEPALESIEFIHRHKTGLPLMAAVRIGGLCAGAEPSALEALTAYGRPLGLAFQITDDLLDETGTEEEMGKAVGKDRSRGKMTYPAVAGIAASEERARALIDEAVEAVSPLGRPAAPLVSIARFVLERRH